MLFWQEKCCLLHYCCHCCLHRQDEGWGSAPDFGDGASHWATCRGSVSASKTVAGQCDSDGDRSAQFLPGWCCCPSNGLPAMGQGSFDRRARATAFANFFFNTLRKSCLMSSCFVRIMRSSTYVVTIIRSGDSSFRYLIQTHLSDFILLNPESIIISSIINIRCKWRVKIWVNSMIHVNC